MTLPIKCEIVGSVKQVATSITVYKLDHTGREKWHYSGEVLDRGENWLRLEARFNGPEGDDGYIVWRHGDRFVEYFYSDRWYNIFEIHDVHDDAIKGWYCNVTYPATINDQSVQWRDLALDVWISPTGELRVLDEDEFQALSLDVATRTRALQTVEEIREHFARRDTPFDVIPSP